MEDILASIRRILSEDDAQPAAAGEPAAPERPGEAAGGHALPPSSLAPPVERSSDVLVLDPGMMVPEAPPTPAIADSHEVSMSPPPPEDIRRPGEPRHGELTIEPAGAGRMEAAGSGRTEPAGPGRMDAAAQAGPGSAPELALDQGPLVDAQTRLAAASSVGNLVRTLSAGRAAAVYRGGPTLEDMVRDLLRPLLKEWLDSHLPPLVERLVATEIEKVVRNSGL